MCRALRAFAGLVESPDEEDYDCFASAGAPAGAQGAKLRFPAFPQRTVPGPDKRLPVGVVLLGRLESALHRRPPLCSDSRSFPAPCVPGRRADAISERPGQASNAMRRNQTTMPKLLCCSSAPREPHGTRATMTLRCSEVFAEALKNSVSGPECLRRQCVRFLKRNCYHFAPWFDCSSVSAPRNSVFPDKHMRVAQAASACSRRPVRFRTKRESPP